MELKDFKFGEHYTEEQIKGKANIISLPRFIIADSPSTRYWFEVDSDGQWHLIAFNDYDPKVLVRNLNPVLSEKPIEVGIVQPDDIKDVLVPGELGAMLELTVTDDKTGKIIEHRVMKSKSFLQQFIQLLYVKMALSPTSAPVSVRDTGNTLRNVAEVGKKGYTFDTTAAITDVTYGIIIGSDNGGVYPLAMDNYKIGTLIPNATMNYSAMLYGNPGGDAGTGISQITLTRNFTATAPTTVNEIALVCQAVDTTGTVRKFMIIRDLIAGGIAVPNGTTLTVNYRLQAQV